MDVMKYLLQVNRLTFKSGMLHCQYIYNDVDYHQLILPIIRQAQVFQMLHNCQGHQGIEWTIALCREHFYGNKMYRDIAIPHCGVAKGHYIGPKTQLSSIIANNTGPIVY